MFTIITKGAVATTDAKREIAPLSARKILKHEYTYRETILSGARVSNPEELGGGTYRPLDRVQDIGEMRRAAKKYKKNYERTAPVSLSPQVRSWMWKRAKQLKDQFVVGMLSKKDIHPVSERSIIKNGKAVTAVVVDNDKMRQTKAIERNAAWTNRNKEKITEFKNIMRALEPANPGIADVERFRPR